MKKIKSPHFTYPRIPLRGRPPEKNEQLAFRLGGRSLFSFAFARLLQGPLADRPKPSILEISAGSGELTRLMVDMARARNRTIQVTATEFQKSAVDACRSASRNYPEIKPTLSSIAELEDLRTAGYDMVVCGFAMHLFAIEQAIAILKTMDRTALHAWLVTDLRRSRWLTMITEALGSWSASNGSGLRDAVALTQQAFTGREMKNLAFHAGIADYEWRGWFLLHQTLTRVKR
jgi:ubiquinone/menaquinone biosynthesis C-methylase UbiE